MPEVVIRNFNKSDRQAVRDIAWQTAFMGESAEIFFQDKEVLCDFLTLYFTDYEPESCFVADSQGTVVGYIIGSLDEKMLNRRFFAHILVRLLFKVLVRGTLLNKRNFKFFISILRDYLRGKLYAPDFYSEYPAVLHINMLPQVRRMGVGSKLIAAFTDYLKQKGVKGVHLATFSDKGISFFKKEGFSVLYEDCRSYLRYILAKDIQVFSFGKKII